MNVTYVTTGALSMLHPVAAFKDIIHRSLLALSLNDKCMNPDNEVLYQKEGDAVMTKKMILSSLQ